VGYATHLNTDSKRAPRARAWLLAAALCAVLAPQASAASAAEMAALAGPARCRFAVPAGWPEPDLRWAGPCRAGLAQGRGVLRAYDQGRMVRAFYGRVQAGVLAFGVIDRDDGFMAGRFEAGTLVADGDRNTIIRAFDEASAAARQLAAGYQKAGNAASARHYRDKARQLALQMD
jgi:hypothetical protein